MSARRSEGKHRNRQAKVRHARARLHNLSKGAEIYAMLAAARLVPRAGDAENDFQIRS
jgi:hypothetical protein